ncbi:HK97 family phage prohead protease [Streptomyces sp. NPDC055085]
MTSTRFQSGGVEERAAPDISGGGDGRTLSGYAAVFHSPTTIREGGVTFTEQVAPGAFANSLATRGMPKIQYAHGRDPVVGTLPIGVMREAAEDSHGLHVRAELFRSSGAEAVREAIAAGAISGMSFAFRVVGETWHDSRGRALEADRAVDCAYRGEDVLRTLTEVDLLEAGPVLTPAYSSTSVGVRAAGGGLGPGARASVLRELLLRRLPL